MLVRSACEEDLLRIAWLEEAGFPDPWPFELLAYELRHPRAFLLVASLTAGAPAAGYAVFRHGGGESELLRLSVDPAARRHGVARALIAGGLERLRQLNIQSCHLEVRTDNEGAIACYRALGFERAGRRKAYYRDGTDALVYSLHL
jgi:ribosomal-protein-alanine N-acetyltransferase